MPYGKDTYIVSASDAGSGLNTSGDMRMMAVGAANDYCAKLGKKMRPDQSSERGNNNWKHPPFTREGSMNPIRCLIAAAALALMPFAAHAQADASI